MNPLAAIRQWASPEAMPLSVKSLQDPAGSAIPVGELKGLGMADPTGNVGQVAPASNSFGQLLGRMVQDVGEKRP